MIQGWVWFSLSIFKMGLFFFINLGISYLEKQRSVTLKGPNILGMRAMLFLVTSQLFFVAQK